MLPQLPVRSRQVSCLPVVIVIALIVIGVNLYNANQVKQFEKYKLPQAAYFPYATEVQSFYIENPTTTAGWTQEQSGAHMDRHFAMNLGHLVLDHAGGAVQPTGLAPLCDFKVFRGPQHIDVFVCLKNGQFWIADDGDNVPLTTIEPGLFVHCVASGHLDKDSEKMQALVDQAFPSDNNDANDSEPTD